MRGASTKVIEEVGVGRERNSFLERASERKTESEKKRERERNEKQSSDLSTQSPFVPGSSKTASCFFNVFVPFDFCFH